MSENHVGKVIQVTGPVLDIRFKEGELPDLHNAIEIMIEDRKLVAEVAQQVGDDVVRCVAMSSTDGLVRGVDATDTGSPITVPVGEECLGRIFNLLGDPVDTVPIRMQKRDGQFIVPLPHTKIRYLLQKSLRQESRSLTLSVLTQKVVRSVFSAVPE